MPSAIARFGMAVAASYQTFRDVWAGVQNSNGLTAEQQRVYTLRWNYYLNTVFEDTNWRTIGDQAGIDVTAIRPLYNPTKRVVDRFVGAIYAGPLSEDGMSLPDGVSIAIPFTTDTAPELKDAVAQTWQWSGFDVMKGEIVQRATALGSLLAEIDDDWQRGKIKYALCWPWHVKDLILDGQGNVKFYALEYMAEDEGGSYRWRKEVDKFEFRYYRDDKLVAREVNPYGFVPAVWFKHSDIGSDHGGAALSGSYNKIDQIMWLATRIHDMVNKVVDGSVLLATDAPLSLTPISGAVVDADGHWVRKPNETLIIQGPQGTTAAQLLGNLNLADSVALLDRWTRELEEDQPILKLYEELRKNPGLTGPAAQRIVGDANGLIEQAQARYNRGMIALFQMAVAIGGERYKTAGQFPQDNGWTRRTAQREKFRYFDLQSYEDGDLDMAIAAQPLFEETSVERATAKTTVFAGIKSAVDAGLPLAMALSEFGWDEKKIARLQQADADAFDQRVSRIATEVGAALVQGREDVTADVRQ